jgi:hypothetical protein
MQPSGKSARVKMLVPQRDWMPTMIGRPPGHPPEATSKVLVPQHITMWQATASTPANSLALLPSAL